MTEIKSKKDNIRPIRMAPQETADAFGDTYNKFNRSLHKYLAYHLDSEEEVADLSQDVYLRVIQNLNPEKKPSWFFLKTIAKNLLSDRFRKRKTREFDAHFSIDAANQEELVSQAASPEQFLEAKQLYMIFRHVVETIKPSSRRAFMLHRIKGLTYEQIGQEMGISKNMVKKHVCYVILEFRKKVDELK